MQSKSVDIYCLMKGFITLKSGGGTSY